MRVPLKSNLFSLNVRPLRQAGIPTDQVFPWTDKAVSPDIFISFPVRFVLGICLFNPAEVRKKVSL